VLWHIKEVCLFSRVYISRSGITILISAILFSGCGPKPAGIKYNIPYDVQVTTQNKSAILKWRVDRRTDIPIGGYNIYLAESAESGGELYNSAPYPGDTDGDIGNESIELNDLDNGKKYYVSIRTVFSDGSLSEPSPGAAFIPLDKGTIEISTNHTTEKSGYSFAKHKYTAARDFDNDIYIYATDSRIGISSPSRLHVSLRETLIKIADDTGGSFEPTQKLVEGRAYILKTAAGGKAKLTLKSITGSPPNVKAIFDYIYYPPDIEL
jgi:hypothetical protein